MCSHLRSHNTHLLAEIKGLTVIGQSTTYQLGKALGALFMGFDLNTPVIAAACFPDTPLASGHDSHQDTARRL